MLLSLLYHWGNWSTKNLSNLKKQRYFNEVFLLCTTMFLFGIVLLHISRFLFFIPRKIRKKLQAQSNGEENESRIRNSELELAKKQTEHLQNEYIRKH